MNLYYNFHFNPLPANVENMVIPNNASKGQMGFNSAFKGLVFVYKHLFECPGTHFSDRCRSCNSRCYSKSNKP